MRIKAGAKDDPLPPRDRSCLLRSIVSTRAVLPALVLVAAVAFITMPYTLGHHPGEAATTSPTVARHMS
jgi:hypothetical protein